MFLINGNLTLSRIRNRLKETAYAAYHGYKPPGLPDSFTKDELAAIKDLSKDKSLIILRPDKGNGVVVMDKVSYRDKVLDILADDTKFKPLSGLNIFDLCTRQEDRLTRLLSKLKSNNIIDKDTYNSLVPSGSRPGILYGLPKTHKPNVPIRPILSAIGTFNYSLAKFFVSILSPVSTSEFCVNSSFDFAKEISSMRNSENTVMASFDVTSLFTNIPLDETLQICLDELYNGSDSLVSIDRNNMKSLLNIAAKESFFIFDNKLYRHGIPTWSCL